MFTEIPTITRTETTPGKYRYDLEDGGLWMNSKVLYTHQSWYRVGDELIAMDHKTEAAAHKASYKYGTKVAVTEIVAK